MKTHPDQEVEQIVERAKALDHAVTPQSLDRFQSNDTLYPIELWMRIQDQNGQLRVRLTKLYPCIIDPAPEGRQLTWTWRRRQHPLEGGYINTIRECPEHIIQNTVRDKLNLKHHIFREIDNRRKLPTLEPAGTAPGEEQ